MRVSLGFAPWARLLLGIAAPLVAVNCYPLGVYTCDGDHNCVDGKRRGRCEATGFCGYPDSTCASERRYDDLAGDGLAWTCVDAPVATATGEESSTTEPPSSSGASGESSGGIPTCDDGDGDGYGQGDGCEGVDCDDDNPTATNDCLYISPIGDDANAGTRDAPFLTFAHALGALQPGASLVALSGTYIADVHGMFVADCGNGDTLNGTPEAPIFVRAEEERRAHLRTGGLLAGIVIKECSYWRVRGLQVSGKDIGEGTARQMYIYSSNEIELRRLLLHTGNRYRGSAELVYLPGSQDVLFEEIEVYAFPGKAFYAVTGPNITFRRVYINGRGVADLPDCSADMEPLCSAQYTDPDGADNGIVMGNEGLVENCVIENTAAGVAGAGVDNASVLGTATIGAQHGVVFAGAGSSRTPFTTGLQLENIVGSQNEYQAVYLRTPVENSVRHVTGVGCGALRGDHDAVLCPPEGCELVGSNLLAVNSPSHGISLFDIDPSFVTHSNVFDSGNAPFYPVEPIDDDDGLWRRCLNEPDERMGPEPHQCIAYIPRDSMMAGAGQNGEDIGANILYRYHDGVLTDEPLWDPATGAFPCGAVIPGINDDPLTSCIGVHERLNVATAGCPLPDDYP